MLTDVDAVDLHHHDVEPGQICAHPFLHARGRQRHEVPRSRRLRHACPGQPGTSPSGICFERKVSRLFGALVIGVIAPGRLIAQGTLEELRRQAGNGSSSLEYTFLALVAEEAFAA
jgi:hypothetical protein